MTYKEIKNKVNEFDELLPITAVNENNENIVIEEGKEESLHFYVITTAQNNGYLRINHYYEDGTVTETFGK